jgi:hypothetical protein
MMVIVSAKLMKLLLELMATAVPLFIESKKMRMKLKMTNCIVCYNHTCKYHEITSCHCAVVEIGSDGCLTYEEKDIYAEVEGFEREA